jgi:GDP-4-dehydro-6-deoxy-D-mannose reductase
MMNDESRRPNSVLIHHSSFIIHHFRMRVLITGITGFVGGHLVEALRADGGHTLFGVSRRADWAAAWRHLAGDVDLRPVDLHDTTAVERIVRDVKPDWVLHLAGYANTGKSFIEPDRCWGDNLTATRSLYDAIHRSGLKPRILFTSTGLVYGDPDDPGRPCDERTTLKPASPYAASKAAADVLSYQVTRSPGLDVVRVRMFNQIGPRQPADYAVANFARQIVAIETGKQVPVIETGDLSAERDVTDVRDIVRAFVLLMSHGKSGEAYNAGRGRAYRIQELLDRLVKLSRARMDVRQRVEPDRKGDTVVVRADTTKLRQATGWEPRYDLDETLKDVLDYWRESVA